ncbi:MAG: hypothetical protein E6X52_00965 [Actinomyces sp.]|jgi:hypothetical protein|uniref:hypothetical protein n=1 Tax=Actinomyces sp. TaxID=29317 RepID=UPI002620BA8F|nr:hypothetical protein [Actinomyces sp.]MDU4831102.1 hypothetical protein [Actinomyces sp.]MDU6757662.1 hypothetical protein [Actinomyces sp.]
MRLRRGRKGYYTWRLPDIDVTQYSTDALAEAVLRGELGDGIDRMQVLGHKYDDVQTLVNRKIDGYARRVLAGEFGDGRERRLRLGYLYPAVQARVNEIVNVKY